MKAVQYVKPGEFQCRKISDPLPGTGEVKIRVAYCGICGTDVHIFRGHMDSRVKVPQAVGHEMSGVIVDVGEDISGWKPGERVTVRPTENCGQCNTCRNGFTHICEHLRFLGIETPGAFAEYWIVPARLLHRLPPGLPLKTAALIEPLAVACHDIRLANVGQGDYVVVLGGGPIGVLIALTARDAGAHVKVIELNPVRRKLIQSLDVETIDPANEDAVTLVYEETGGSGADIVFEVSGSTAGAAQITELVRPRGTIVVVAIFGNPVPIDLHKFFWKELKMIGARVYEECDFDLAIKLADSEKLPLTQLIDNEFPMEKVNEAFAYLTQTPDAMKILINCGGEK